jgi:transcriptional regulator with XRE-family HTH domain
MPNGYSLTTVDAIQNANSTLLGVQLGRICLKNNISAKDVAEFFGVSRMTVYNWFKGKTVVSGKYAEKMGKLITKLS